MNLPTPSPEIKQQILWEDADFIALNKYPSQVVQTDKQQTVSLAQQVERYLKETHKSTPPFCGVIHRLDRRASGVCLFAKNKEALAALNLAFQKGEIKKIYWAIVQNLPQKEEDTLIDFLLKKEAANKSFIVKEGSKEAQKAILHYKLKAKSSRYFLLEVELETGRHHQIRAQLSHIGCPIKGDLKYGSKRSNPDGSISLHAKALSFKHPKTGKTITLAAPPPPDNLWNFFYEEMKGKD